MAYNAQTGLWEDEDAGVAQRVASTVAQDSPLMRQARTTGLKMGNRRGLLNSSMSIGAAQNEAYRVALPIASQESSQIHERNLQAGDISNRERMQTRGFEHETGMQTRDIASREGMQTRDITSREGMQTREIGANTATQQRDIASRERMLADELASRGLDRESQERIVNLNISTDERQAASQLAASFENSYATMFANIMNNPDLPAAERTRYAQQAAAIRDSNLRLVEQMYNIDLVWGAGSGAPTTGAGAGSPTSVLPPDQMRGLLSNIRFGGV